MRQSTRPRNRHHGSPADKNYFTIYTKLFPTGEVFETKRVYPEMTIGQLKSLLEFNTGIPTTLQRLTYLDDGDLVDTTDVKSHDIVAGGTFRMHVWSQWLDLVEAVVQNEIDTVMSLGVSMKVDLMTPGTQSMSRRAKMAWVQERALVALCIAAHRGHLELCSKLIEMGADVNATTKLGRTPLHVATSQGHGKIVDLLLDNGADIDAQDVDGNTALNVADSFNHKACGRHLFLFRWQQRAKLTQPSRVPPMMAHQIHDSAFPVWLKGPQSQLYFSNVLTPGEFEGSSLHARPHQKWPVNSFKQRFPNDVIQAIRMLVDAPIGEPECIVDISTNPAATDKANGGLAVIEEMSTTSFQEKTQQQKKSLSLPRLNSSVLRSRPLTHREWLSKKRAIEQEKLSRIIEEEERRRQQEEDSLFLSALEELTGEEQTTEDPTSEGQSVSGKRGASTAVVATPSLPEQRKKNETEKTQSYETWLQQQLSDRKRQTADRHTGFGGQSTGQNEKKGALRTYLMSLLHNEDGGPCYDEWLISKELEMLDSVETRPIMPTK